MLVGKLKEEFSEEGKLCCSCGGDYMHHESVEIFEREEDAGIGLHLLIADGEISLDGDVVYGNPSRRRHGLKITFTCEMCDTVTVLNLAQHKGQTFMWAEETPPVPAEDTATDNARLRKENKLIRREFMEREEEEASVCPENVGAVEYIRSLLKIADRLISETMAQGATIEQLRAELIAARAAALAPSEER